MTIKNASIKKRLTVANRFLDSCLIVGSAIPMWLLCRQRVYVLVQNAQRDRAQNTQ